MIQTKLFEVRDRATFIPVIASLMGEPRNAVEHYLLRRSGYAEEHPPLVLLTKLQGGTPANCDSFDWDGGSRTMHEAHKYIQDRWNELESGDVIDVEFILGESVTKKVSERLDGDQDQ